ncbi:sel1 repeat family protein [Anaerobiospirillum sp. NML120448]|uniref:tetratricopeptide repeat protein n=1 Tax=Anaerobiospirillum sp. NML120448 TaxID=2932816 RepID=UPI001FF6EDFF|nr:tetratricopeptide repeat protein [Anaerobiospirillum sp. NML120448]MCK0513611.1 sel1 repeat family protein [Anaerobiospirillum sp. NML120448]
MANMLKKIKEMERRELIRYRQRLTVVTIGFLFFIGIFSGIIWAYTSHAEGARRELVENGIKALSYSDFRRAVSYLEKADKDDDPYAAEFLAWYAISAGNYEQAAKYAERAVLFRRHAAYEVLGDLALLGFGKAKGIVAAISYFEQGAIRIANDEAAAIKAGTLVTDKWFQGDPATMMPDDIRNRATDLFSGMVYRALQIIPNGKDFVDFVLLANKKGAKSLELIMGDMFFVGNNKIASNAQSAVQYWQQAMDNGFDQAYVRLAGAYWHGYAVERDPQTAFDLYSSAAANHDPVAQYALGLIALRSNSTSTSNVAVKFFSSAAAQGYGPASSALGVFAYTETNTPDSLDRAIQWLKIAALEQHDLSGRIIYDLMLMSGKGVPKAFSKGFDDLISIANIYPPAQKIIDLLQERVPAEQILDQVMVLANQVLRGHIAYKEGDPIFELEILDPTTLEPMERPFTFYQSVDKLAPTFKNHFGSLNFTSVTDLNKVNINGKNILDPSLAQVIVQYAPSTGVVSFAADPRMPRPKAPKVPNGYEVSDFVPPVSLVEPLSLRDENGVYNKVQ